MEYLEYSRMQRAATHPMFKLEFFIDCAWAGPKSQHKVSFLKCYNESAIVSCNCDDSEEADAAARLGTPTCSRLKQLICNPTHKDYWEAERALKRFLGKYAPVLRYSDASRAILYGHLFHVMELRRHRAGNQPPRLLTLFEDKQRAYNIYLNRLLLGNNYYGRVIIGRLPDGSVADIKNVKLDRFHPLILRTYENGNEPRYVVQDENIDVDTLDFADKRNRTDKAGTCLACDEHYANIEGHMMRATHAKAVRRLIYELCSKMNQVVIK